MADLPMHYQTSYRWQKDAAAGLTCIEGHVDLPVGTPHDADRFCPEHLLIATAKVCLACHGTDAQLADEFASWQTYLAQSDDAYPAREEIESMMKTHAATVAKLADCHPRFQDKKARS